MSSSAQASPRIRGGRSHCEGPGTHQVPGLRSLLGGRALGFLLIAWHAVELEQLLKGSAYACRAGLYAASRVCSEDRTPRHVDSGSLMVVDTGVGLAAVGMMSCPCPWMIRGPLCSGASCGVVLVGVERRQCLTGTRDEELKN